jgi:hypothetical protein
MKRRTLITLLGVGTASLPGCLGQSTPGSDPTDTSSENDTDTETATATPLPAGDVDFSDGPKEQPARPAELTESTVREYVKTHEYRYAYNSLWMNEYSDVELSCRVDSVSERSWGYEAVVTCTGYSNTDVPENSTATPGPHADWFTQSFRYRVSADATHREQTENRDPVS